MGVILATVYFFNPYGLSVLIHLFAKPIEHFLKIKDLFWPPSMFSKNNMPPVIPQSGCTNYEPLAGPKFTNLNNINPEDQ